VAVDLVVYFGVGGGIFGGILYSTTRGRSYVGLPSKVEPRLCGRAKFRGRLRTRARTEGRFKEL